MVVVPEPAVKGGRSLAAGAVDRAVGPTVEQGADEAFGFAVGLRPARAGAQVPDPERATGERVDARAVGGAVVGQQPLDLDPVTGVEGERSAEEADRGCGF